MRQIFSYDGPLMSALTRIGDCICLSVLWIVFSLPVITLGASTTALYAAAYHCVRKNEDGLWHAFWGAFREEWKRSTLTGLIALALIALLTADVFLFRSFKLEGRPIGELYYVILVLWCLAVTWAVYLAAYTARVSGSVWQTIRFGYLLMILHPLRAMSVLVMVIAGLFLALLAPILLLVAPAAVMAICTFPMEKTFQTHTEGPNHTEQLEETSDDE